MNDKTISKQKGKGIRRGAGQAVAAMVMALAVAVGGAGTTALLLTQPTGLAVEPTALLWEQESTDRSTAYRHSTKAAQSETPKVEPEASSQAQPEAEQPAQPETVKPAETTAAEPAAAPAETAPATSEPAAEAPTQPETPADPMGGSAAEIEQENAFPKFQQETEALAAEDPLRAPEETPAESDNAGTEPAAEPAAESVKPAAEPEAAPAGAEAVESAAGAETEPAQPTAGANSIEDELAEAQITTEDGTILLTPEEIRAALDAGTLDEAELETACLDSENGFFKWLWKWFFGIKDEEDKPAAPSKPAEPVYSGWRTVGGKTYYYDQGTNKPVTGIRAIDNKLYYFDANGVQTAANFGIDVSKYQSKIDWQQVKQAGVNFVIIRIGYRGYGSGTLVQDPLFEQHFTNARNAGLKVGVYFFSQAVNENEAREEAQGCWYVLNGRGLDYPIYFDSEASGASNGGGRADGLGQADRTKCAIAFCEEVKALGYQPGVYASTQWFRKRLDLSQLTGYSIWNAHYNVASSPIACNLWQGSCSARISGYSGQLDVNISYMG